MTEEDIEAVTGVLRGDWLTTGPKLEEFEKALAKRVKAPAAAAVSSGTAALHLAHLAAGICKEAEVITTPITFAATANAALYVGATPVFADVDEDTLNLSPDAAEAAITERTKAIVPVHYTGRSCEMDLLRALCDKHGLLLIEDASHALGAVYKGTAVGSGRADLATWSFHPVKHIAAGEGGAVTGDPKLVELVKDLRNHGKGERDGQPRPDWFYDVKKLGFNYRLTDICAALATSQLERLDANLARRRELAALYADKLSRFEELRLPVADDADHVSAWHLYVVRLRLEKLTVGRKDIFDALRTEKIGVNVHYIPVYRHSLYKARGYKKGLCPVAEQAYEEMLTLPLFPLMTDNDLDDVVCAMDKVLARYSRK
jgi:perosamine synthetase